MLKTKKYCKSWNTSTTSSQKLNCKKFWKCYGYVDLPNKLSLNADPGLGFDWAFFDALLVTYLLRCLIWNSRNIRFMFYFAGAHECLIYNYGLLFSTRSDLRRLQLTEGFPFASNYAFCSGPLIYDKVHEIVL